MHSAGHTMNAIDVKWNKAGAIKPQAQRQAF
jgi:hypothetical protein